MGKESNLKAFDLEPDGLWKQLVSILQSNHDLRTAKIRKAFEKWGRHLFVDQTNTSLVRMAAGVDFPLSIGFGQTISQPKIVAWMTELLKPKFGDRVLDIGLGSGWQTAILRECIGLRGRVFAIERIAGLLDRTMTRFRELGIDQVEFVRGDATDRNDIPDGPFDIITSAAGCENEPEFWKERLADRGSWFFQKK